MASAITYRFVQERIHAAQADIERAKQEIAAASTRIDNLHGEIGDLLAAARVLARLDGSVGPAQSEISGIMQEPGRSDFDPFEKAGNPYRPSTNKAFMWKVLADADKVWLTANEIQEIATKLRGSEIPMSSDSPGLSEMKQDGSIDRDGMRVALKSRLYENGAPRGAPDAEGVAASSNKPFKLFPVSEKGNGEPQPVTAADQGGSILGD